MALSAAQKVNTRRWAGYPLMADAPATETSDIAYVRTRNQITTLEHRLNNLTTEEEAVLIDVYLTNLTTLEAAIPAMSDDLDTNAAGTWVANPQEVGQRIRLFNKWRREMCAFIGVEPGPGLESSGTGIVRG